MSTGTELVQQRISAIDAAIDDLRKERAALAVALTEAPRSLPAEPMNGIVISFMVDDGKLVKPYVARRRDRVGDEGAHWFVSGLQFPKKWEELLSLFERNASPPSQYQVMGVISTVEVKRS